MQVISQWKINGTITEEEIKKDKRKLKKLHRAALQEHPMWDIFGGVISIEDRRYQVTS